MDSSLVPQNQTLVVQGTNVDLYGVVDQIVAHSIGKKDPYSALNAAATLRMWGKISGIVLAKLLFEVMEAWDVYETDDMFIDMAEMYGDIDKQTVRKYTSIWGAVILGCPRELRGKFEKMPMETLWLIAPAAKSGDITDEYWDKLSKCTIKSEVRALIREIRGDRTSSSSALILTLKRDGSLVARRGDETDFFGYLSVDKDTKLVQDAIDKVSRGVGLVIE